MKNINKNTTKENYARGSCMLKLEQSHLGKEVYVLIENELEAEPIISGFRHLFEPDGEFVDDLDKFSRFTSSVWIPCGPVLSHDDKDARKVLKAVRNHFPETEKVIWFPEGYLAWLADESAAEVSV